MAHGYVDLLKHFRQAGNVMAVPEGRTIRLALLGRRVKRDCNIKSFGIQILKS